jgi:hypothetical protein
VVATDTRLPADRLAAAAAAGLSGQGAAQSQLPGAPGWIPLLNAVISVKLALDFWTMVQLFIDYRGLL